MITHLETVFNRSAPICLGKTLWTNQIFYSSKNARLQKVISPQLRMKDKFHLTQEAILSQMYRITFECLLLGVEGGSSQELVQKHRPEFAECIQGDEFTFPFKFLRPRGPRANLVCVRRLMVVRSGSMNVNAGVDTMPYCECIPIPTTTVTISPHPSLTDWRQRP